MRTTNLMKYVGSKCKMMKHLQSIFDEIPHRCFVDVFGGAASVMLNKTPSPVDVINDINGNIYTLYKCLRDSTLCEKLYNSLDSTLYSRDEWNHARDVLRGSLQVDDVERARCTFLLYNASFAGNGTTYGFTKTAPKHLNAMLSKTDKILPIFHQRLKKVHIENSDFSDLFKRYDSPTTLFYFDPPYYSSTRTKKIYSDEMNDADHERLLRCILDCEGSCVLSGYDNAMYNDVLNGLEKRTFTATTIIRQKSDGRQKRTECVWIKKQTHI